MTKKEMHTAFNMLCNEMAIKMERKNQDYSRGESPFKNLERHGLFGITVRLDDKINRLDSLTNPLYATNAASVSDESLEDTAMDTATYALLIILLNRHLKEKKK